MTTSLQVNQETYLQTGTGCLFQVMLPFFVNNAEVFNFSSKNLIHLQNLKYAGRISLKLHHCYAAFLQFLIATKHGI